MTVGAVSPHGGAIEHVIMLSRRWSLWGAATAWRCREDVVSSGAGTPHPAALEQVGRWHGMDGYAHGMLSR